jgi:hypothetical protein
VGLLCGAIATYTGLVEIIELNTGWLRGWHWNDKQWSFAFFSQNWRRVDQNRSSHFNESSIARNRLHFDRERSVAHESALIGSFNGDSETQALKSREWWKCNQTKSLIQCLRGVSPDRSA